MARIDQRICLCTLVVSMFSSAPVLAHDHDGHDLDAATAATMVKLLDGKKMTLAKAVAQAANVSGGSPVSAACTLADGIGRPDAQDPKMAKFTMYCIESKDLWDVHLNGDGALLESGTAKRDAIDADTAMHWDAWNAATRAMADNKMTLAKAIEAAEQHTKGRALAAAAVVADKATVICVHCVTGDKVTCCTVALDGKVSDAAVPAEKPAEEPKKP